MSDRLCLDEWLCVLRYLYLSEVSGVLPCVNRHLRGLTRDPRCYRELHFLADTTDATVQALVRSGRVAPQFIKRIWLVRCHQMGLEGIRELCRLFRGQTEAEAAATAEQARIAQDSDATHSAAPHANGAAEAALSDETSAAESAGSATLQQAVFSLGASVTGVVQAVRHAVSVSDAVSAAASGVVSVPRDAAHIVEAAVWASSSQSQMAPAVGPRVVLESLTLEGCSQLFEEYFDEAVEDGGGSTGDGDGDGNGNSDDEEEAADEPMEVQDDSSSGSTALRSTLANRLMHTGQSVLAYMSGRRPRQRNSFQYVRELIQLVSPTLRSFALRYVQPASWGLFQLHLCSCAELRRLHLVGVSPFEPLLHGLRASLVTRLQELWLSDHNIIDVDLLVLLQHNPDLHTVRITSRTNIDRSIAHMLCNMTQLTALDLSLCYDVGDSNFAVARRIWDTNRRRSEEGAPRLRTLQLDHSNVGKLTLPFLTLPTESIEQELEEAEAARRDASSPLQINEQRQAASRRGPWSWMETGSSKRKRNEVDDTDSARIGDSSASKLSQLALPWAPLDSRCPPQLRSLQVLTVHSCMEFDDRSLSLAVQVSGTLTHVDVSATSVGSASVQLLVAKHARSLTVLSLAGCQHVHGDALQAISTHCREHLRSLDLSNIFALDKNDLRVLFQPLPDAAQEGAHHGLSDDGSVSAGRAGRESHNSLSLSRWHQLNSLLLDGVVGIDDELLCWIVEGVIDSRAHAQHTQKNPLARTLDSYTMAQAEAQAPARVSEQKQYARRSVRPVLCPRLERLSVRSSTLITDDAIRLLRVGYPKLQLSL